MASATTYRLQDPSTRWRGLVVVLLLHLLLGWLLLSGTLDKGLDLAKKAPESIVIQEVLIAPPPAPMTPPPRDTKPPATKAAPSQTTAPPAAVAPVEMAAPPAAAPTISAVPVAPTTALPVVPPVLATAVVAAAASMPTVPAAPALAPLAAAPGSPASPALAPLAAAPGKPAAPALAPLATVPGTPISSDIGLACPTQIPPDTPLRARQSGTTGVVVAQATIRNGAVTDVTILSGPAVFHAAVRNAMRQYKCNENADEAVVTQRFVFKLE